MSFNNSEVQPRLAERYALWLWCLVIASMLGCEKLTTQFGPSKGVTGRKSLGGFGVMREYYRQHGWQDRDINSLSERMNSYHTIVWTSDYDYSPSNEVTDWFDEWLGRGDRTLVYIIGDHQIVDAYWQRAVKYAPAEQRLEYRRRVARARMQKLQQLAQLPPLISNGWFSAVPTAPPAPLGTMQGEWADEVSQLPGWCEAEFELRAYDQKVDAAIAANAANKMYPWTSMGVTTGSSADPGVDFEPLLSDSQGKTVVGRVHAPRWGSSQVIVVTPGSLLTNFGLVDTESRALLAKIEESCREPIPDDEERRVAYMYTNQFGASVNSLNPENSGPTGLEMLTLWPLNVVTIHALLCGIFFCLMLFPIVGRPKRLPPAPTADFASHIDAVAKLMAKTQGLQYARMRISEYFVRVRGEHEGPWVLPAPSTPPVVEKKSEQANAEQLNPNPFTVSETPSAQWAPSPPSSTTSPASAPPNDTSPN